MTPHSTMRPVSLPPALLLSLIAHAALIAAIVGMDDPAPAPPRPGGIIAVEIVVEGPKSHPGVKPAPRRAAAPNIPTAAPSQPATGRIMTPRPAAAMDSSPTPPPRAIPPRARRKPLHFAQTGIPLEKPTAVTRLPTRASHTAQPRGANRLDRQIHATLTPAAQPSAGDRGASPRGDNPKPAYPFVARQRGQQGVVFLHVEVLPDGTAGRVEIARSSGFRSLDAAARHAVARWRFLPARQGGGAVAALVTVPVRFSLH